jgi:Ser/Thr protein kinase RdoA (MazF antagonist)
MNGGTNCEVRQWLRWRAERAKEWLQEALDDIARRRGSAAAARLRADIGDQWSKGNRGVWGDWR